jgi:hypothetical protein
MSIFAFKGGRNNEDKSFNKPCLIGAVPVAVGTASVGALLGIELSKGRAHEKIGQTYIMSEVYEDDDNDDFHLDAD